MSSTLLSCKFQSFLKLLGQKFLELKFWDLHFILSNFFSIGLFLGLYYTILPCQKCTKIVIVEAIEVAIECHFLLT